MLISQITPNLNNNYANNSKFANQKRNPSFTSTGQTAETVVKTVDKYRIFSPLTKGYDALTNLIAHGIGKILDIESVSKTFEKLGKSEHLKKHGLAHLIVLGSTMLSGFYVKKTLDNDKLDKDKKTTLAINQAATWAISTILAYTIDGQLVGAVKKIQKNFLKLNNIDEKSNLGKQYGRGFTAARTIIVIGTVYRFIAPVLVTPIANAIGNHMLAKKEAEKTNKSA